MNPDITLTEDLVAELLRLGTATLYEASGSDFYLPATLRPVWRGAAAVGWALPVSMTAADNLPLHVALEVARPGDLIVADGQAEVCGYFGEVLAVASQQRGVVGLVIDGGVRDTDRLSELGFPVFSSSIAIRGTGKADAGTVGAPIRLGRSVISHGDLVVADADGIVSLPSDRIADVLASARGRAQKEADYLERLRAGELSLDIYGFRSLLTVASEPAASHPSTVAREPAAAPD